MPSRTIDACAEAKRRAAAVQAMCRNVVAGAAADARKKSASCLSVYRGDALSASARCENTPSHSRCLAVRRKSMTAGRSGTRIPIRLVPVSILRCTRARRPQFRAARSTSRALARSQITTETPLRIRGISSVGCQALKTKIFLERRESRARTSSPEATQKPQIGSF